MGPFALLLLFLVADRVIQSGRVRRLDGVRPRWVRGRAAVFGYVRSAPATYTYAFVLLITSWVLETSSASIARRLLLERSTNLDHLARDPVHVLVASAFWLENGGQFFVWLVLLSLVVAPFERRVGSRLTIAVFAIGHILATLLTAAGLWVALQLDAVEHSVARAQDVGASYGFFAVAGCLVYLVAGPLRRWYLAVVLTVVAVPLVVSTTFTDFGHLLSVGLGLACRPLVDDVPVDRPLGRPLGERLLLRGRRTALARILARVTGAGP